MTTPERRPLISPIDQAIVDVRRRQEWVRKELLINRPQLSEKAIKEILDRDPAVILVKAVVSLRREVERLTAILKYAWTADSAPDQRSDEVRHNYPHGRCRDDRQNEMAVGDFRCLATVGP